MTRLLALLASLVLAVIVLAGWVAWCAAVVTAEPSCESDWFQAADGAWLCVEGGLL